MEDNTKARISVVINTYNAEEHPTSTLDSVSDFDEVVVCDMESTGQGGCFVHKQTKGEKKPLVCSPSPLCHL